MADAQSQNNPAGEAPTEADIPSSDDILAVFDLGDSASTADAIAAGNPSPPQPAAASPAPAEAGGVETAPASPVSSPSGEPPAPAPAPAAPAPAPATPSAEPTPALSGAPETPPAAPPAVDENALRTASLTAQVDALTRELEQLRASPQTGSQPAPQATPAAPETGQQGGPPTVPFKYGLTLPEPVQQMLLSDDPAKNVQAIQAIVNDLGTIVHHSVISQVRGEMQQALAGLLQQANSAVEGDTRQQAAEQAREAYYTKFPDHKNPLMLPIVQAEAQKLAAEFPHLQWGDQYMNALGVRVQNAVAALSGQPPQPSQDPTPQPAPQGGNAPPARPAAMLPSGSRPAPVTPSGEISEQIMEVLDPFSA